MAEYGFALDPLESLVDLDALIIAVPHEAYLLSGWNSHVRRLRCGGGGVVMDIKAAFYGNRFDERVRYWSL